MIVRESIFRDVLRLLVWYPVRWLILLLPVRWGIRLMRTMGDLHCLLSRGKKRRLRENLRRMMGEEAEHQGGAIREYFRNHYIDRLMIFVFPRFGPGVIGEMVEISGLEHLDEALRKGRGAVLVHGHFGPVHVPLVVLARMGYGMKQIGLPSDEGLSWVGRNVAYRLRLRYEDMIPAEIIKADSFLRPVFRWLGENGVVMVTGDGSGTDRLVGKHVDHEFFGHRFHFPLGPSMMAEKTGAGLLPMFITPGRNGRYNIIIEEPLRSDLSGEEKLTDITGQFARRLEDHVHRYPGYMHFLDRFHPGGLI
jgi:KDO2-lipid IV(A) lauroyltransferase